MAPAVRLSVWLVVLNERTNFGFPYRMAAFYEEGVLVVVVGCLGSKIRAFFKLVP